MNPQLLVQVCEIVFKLKYESWIEDFSLSIEAIDEAAQRVDMSISRLRAYVQVIMENRKKGLTTPLYDNILVKEFGYSDNMNFPDMKTWWPIGLNHGIDDIFKKYEL